MEMGFRCQWAGAGCAAALGVALSRMRAVRHDPSDVVVGALLGGAIGATTAKILRRRLTAEAVDS